VRRIDTALSALSSRVAQDRDFPAHATPTIPSVLYAVTTSVLEDAAV
jgi:hypothetical protein